MQGYDVSSRERVVREMKTDSEIMTVQTPPHPRYTSFCSHCVCYKTLNYCQRRTKKHSNTTQAYLHIHDEYVPEIIAKGTRTLAVLGLQFALRNFFYTNFDNQAHKTPGESSSEREFSPSKPNGTKAMQRYFSN